MKQIHLIHEKDNTGSALEPIAAGEICRYQKGGISRDLRIVDDIPFAFKIAIDEIPEGTSVIKYGEVIGEASQDIHIGELVHVHNVIGTRA